MLALLLAASTFTAGLVPAATFGAPGTAMIARFNEGQFATAGTSALAVLWVDQRERLRLDVWVSGPGTADYAVRVYSRGSCDRPLNWVVNHDTSGSSVLFPRALTNRPLRTVLAPSDQAELRAELAKGYPAVVMLAPRGAGRALSGSPLRTCALLESLA